MKHKVEYFIFYTNKHGIACLKFFTSCFSAVCYVCESMTVWACLPVHVCEVGLLFSTSIPEIKLMLRGCATNAFYLLSLWPALHVTFFCFVFL